MAAASLSIISFSPLAFSAGVMKSTENHVIVKGKTGQFGRGDYVQFRDQSGKVTGTGHAYRATGTNSYFQVLRGTAPKGTRPVRTTDLNDIFGKGVYGVAAKKDGEDEISSKNTFSIILFGGLYTSTREFPDLIPGADGSKLNGPAYGGDFRYGYSRIEGGLALRVGAKLGRTPAEDNPLVPELSFLSYNGGVEYVFRLSPGARFGLGSKFEYTTYSNEDGLEEVRRHITPLVNLYFIFAKSIAMGFEYQRPLRFYDEFKKANEDIVSLNFEISF